MVAPVEDRKFAEQRDTKLPWRILRERSRQLVDAREPHLHPELIAERGCLIYETAALGPMDVDFLQCDKIGHGSANCLDCAGKVTIAGSDVVGHHAERERRARDGQVRARDAFIGWSAAQRRERMRGGRGRQGSDDA